MKALSPPALEQENTWTPYVPYPEEPGFARTTLNLALTALTLDKPVVPYVGNERRVAYDIGMAMRELLLISMVDHHEPEIPRTGFSTFSHQLLQAYHQLLYGTGELESGFRERFLYEFGRFPVEINDIRGGRNRRADANYITRIVSKFCPWQDVALDFARCVVSGDDLLKREFMNYFFWVFLPKMKGRVLGLSKGEERDGTNTATLLIEQDMEVMKFTFGQRRWWFKEKRTITYVGKSSDKTGATFEIDESALDQDEALAILKSFNWRAEGEAEVLDARERALGARGFAIVTAKDRKGRVLMNTRGLKQVF